MGEVAPMSRPALVKKFMDSARPTSLKQFQEEWKALSDEEKNWYASECSRELGIPIKE